MLSAENVARPNNVSCVMWKQQGQKALYFEVWGLGFRLEGLGFMAKLHTNDHGQEQDCMV